MILLRGFNDLNSLTYSVFAKPYHSYRCPAQRPWHFSLAACLLKESSAVLPPPILFSNWRRLTKQQLQLLPIACYNSLPVLRPRTWHLSLHALPVRYPANIPSRTTREVSLERAAARGEAGVREPLRPAADTAPGRCCLDPAPATRGAHPLPCALQRRHLLPAVC